MGGAWRGCPVHTLKCENSTHNPLLKENRNRVTYPIRSVEKLQLLQFCVFSNVV